MRRLVTIVCLLWLCAPALVQGAPADFGAKLDEAKSARQSPLQALKLMREGIAILWATIPFGVQEVRLLKTPPGENGQLSPREPRPFKPGELLVIYLEPVGFTVKRHNDLFNYSLSVDFKLVDAWGHIAGSQQNVSAISGPAFSFPDHLSMVISLQLLGLGSGDYKLETTVRDRMGGKSCAFTTEFQID